MDGPMTNVDKIINNYELIFIDKRSVGSPVAKRLLELAPTTKIQICESKPQITSSGNFTGDEYARSKKLLFITEHAGLFFKRCPGAKKGLACCNYFVLNLGLQCDMDCSYCYLQSFINTPYTIIYSNIDQALIELQNIYNDSPNTLVRIGTGEVIDSLSLDPLSLYSKTLMSFFKDKPNWKLEFKTKSNYVDQFIDEEHAGNVIVSWSINPQYIVGREEHRTASLAQRLEAAKKCLDKKFQIAFHIDPVIWHEEWKTNYTLLIDEITSRFKPTDMPYISIGSLRFKAEQKDMMRERFGMSSLVTQAEMFSGAAGKMRYDQALREEMFQFIIQEFKKRDISWKIFLCMETPETWINATGDVPMKKDEIRGLFKPLQLNVT
jgi:spore photoproduct lyase